MPGRTRCQSSSVGPIDDAPARSVSTEWKLELEIKLADRRAESDTLSNLVADLSDYLAASVFLVSTTGRMVCRAVPAGSSASSMPTMDRLGIDNPSSDQYEQAFVRIAHAGAERSFCIAPIVDDRHVFAWIAVTTDQPLPTPHIDWGVARAAVHLTAEFVNQRRLARVARNARENLARQMVRSTTYDADLRACASYLGVDLTVNRVVAFVLERGRASGSTVDARRLGELVGSTMDVDVLSIQATQGVILAIESPGSDNAEAVVRTKAAVLKCLDLVGDQHAVAGISSLTRPGKYQRAYREALEAARCADRYPSESNRVIASDELGPARLLVANSNEPAVRTYVYDTLGELLLNTASNVELLRTLQAFFENGRGVRETANRLAVHENTVRHRLKKLHDLTGLDVAGNSNDQLSVQTALLVLRLQGHHAVPGFAEMTR